MTYGYAIKLCEPIARNEVTRFLSEDGGLYLMAFDLKEPWAIDRKYPAD